MKTIIKSTSVVFALCMISFVAPLFAAENASAVLKKVDRAEGYTSSYSEVEQIITTSSGSKRKLIIRSWAVNKGDKQLSLYLAPSDVKGQKILMTDDGNNIWMFNSETRRTRKLGSHMKRKKVMGSDFTYEDQAGGKISEKYRGVIKDEEECDGVKCYVLELIPTPKGPGYKKIIAWVGKEDYLTRRIDYYEKSMPDRPYKRLLCSDIRRAGGKLTSFKVVMKSLLDTTETVMNIRKVRFDVKIPGKVFLPGNLGR